MISCKSMQKSLEMQAKLDNSYQRGKRDGFEEGCEKAFEMFFYMTAHVMSMYWRERVYVSKQKIIDCMYRVLENIDCYRTGQLSSEDFKEIKKEVINNGMILKKDRRVCK